MKYSHRENCVQILHLCKDFCFEPNLQSHGLHTFDYFICMFCLPYQKKVCMCFFSFHPTHSVFSTRFKLLMIRQLLLVYTCIDKNEAPTFYIVNDCVKISQFQCSFIVYFHFYATLNMFFFVGFSSHQENKMLAHFSFRVLNFEHFTHFMCLRK